MKVLNFGLTSLPCPQVLLPFSPCLQQTSSANPLPPALPHTATSPVTSPNSVSSSLGDSQQCWRLWNHISFSFERDSRARTGTVRAKEQVLALLHFLCSNYLCGSLTLTLKLATQNFSSLDFSIHEMGDYVSCQPEDYEEYLPSTLSSKLPA